MAAVAAQQTVINARAGDVHRCEQSYAEEILQRLKWLQFERGALPRPGPKKGVKTVFDKPTRCGPI